MEQVMSKLVRGKAQSPVSDGGDVQTLKHALWSCLDNILRARIVEEAVGVRDAESPEGLVYKIRSLLEALDRLMDHNNISWEEVKRMSTGSPLKTI